MIARVAYTRKINTVRARIKFMNIVFYRRKNGIPEAASVQDMRVIGAFLSGTAVLLVAGAFYAGYLLGYPAGSEEQAAVERTTRDGALASSDQAAHQVMAEIDREQQDVIETRIKAMAELDAMGVALGAMNARMVRIDALGERLVKIAKLEAGEFDFTASPPQGGPVEVGDGGLAIRPSELTESYKVLLTRLTNRERQLQILESMIAAQELTDELSPAGRPVDSGWISSRFGRRQDPMSGRKSFHRGVDFAAKVDSQVHAVAAGVVTYSGNKSHYGNVVEIDHGNGYATRYGHNKKNVVKAGDVVVRGQQIAALGSTGRSTGPHVHFEVIRDGKRINPMRFINNRRK